MRLFAKKVTLFSYLDFVKIIEMKRVKKELNVDYIGGEPPMTLAEEKELSKYFKKKKSNDKSLVKKVKQKAEKKSKV